MTDVHYFLLVSLLCLEVPVRLLRMRPKSFVDRNSLKDLGINLCSTKFRLTIRSEDSASDRDNVHRANKIHRTIELITKKE